MAVGKESIKRAANASAETGTKTRTTRVAKAVKETEAAEVKTAVVTPVDKEEEKAVAKAAAGSRPVQIKDELPVYLL